VRCKADKSGLEETKWNTQRQHALPGYRNLKKLKDKRNQRLRDGSPALWILWSDEYGTMSFLAKKKPSPEARRV